MIKYIPKYPKQLKCRKKVFFRLFSKDYFILQTRKKAYNISSAKYNVIFKVFVYNANSFIR